MTLLQLDHIDIAHREDSPLPFNVKHVKKSIKHTITLDYGEVTDIAPDIRLTLHNAGHILGSAITHMHIGDGPVSYTHLKVADKIFKIDDHIGTTIAGAVSDAQSLMKYISAEVALFRLRNGKQINVEAAATLTSNTVSYTHLDVYKRQAFYFLSSIYPITLALKHYVCLLYTSRCV